MKPLIRTLTPVGFSPDEWTQKVTTTSLITSDDIQIEYHGDVLTSTLQTGHYFEFELTSSPLRPSELSIPLTVSKNALISLSINAETIRTITLPASVNQTPLLHYLADDVTKWAEYEATIRVKLTIYYQGQKGRTTFFLDNNQAQLRPTLFQRWSWRYALQAISFFCMSWLTIAGTATLVLAHFRLFGDTVRDFTVIITVLSWIIPLLGLPILSN